MAQTLLQQGQPVALATLYNAVRTLVDHGLVEKSRLDGGRGLLWLKERRRSPLHQLVCRGCQRSFVAADVELSAHVARLCAQHGMALGGPSVLVQVQCAECARHPARGAALSRRTSP